MPASLRWMPSLARCVGPVEACSSPVSGVRRSRSALGSPTEPGAGSYEWERELPTVDSGPARVAPTMDLDDMRAPLLVALLAASGPAVGQELPLVHFAAGDPRLPLPSSSVQAVSRTARDSSGSASSRPAWPATTGTRSSCTASTTASRTRRPGGGRGRCGTPVGRHRGRAERVRAAPRPLRARQRVRFLREVGGRSSRDPDPARLVGRLRGGGGVGGVAGEGVVRYRFGADGDLEVGVVGASAGDARRHCPPSVCVKRGSCGSPVRTGRWRCSPRGASGCSRIAPWLAPTAPVTAFGEGADGAWWAGCRDGSLWRLEGPGGRFVAVDRSLPSR